METDYLVHECRETKEGVCLHQVFGELGLVEGSWLKVRYFRVVTLLYRFEMGCFQEREDGL